MFFKKINKKKKKGNNLEMECLYEKEILHMSKYKVVFTI